VLTPQTKTALENTAKNICRQHHLSQFYFAQSLGPRRHYLAGYGQQTFNPAQHLTLSENVVVFWQGTLPDQARTLIKQALRPIAQMIEREISMP